MELLVKNLFCLKGHWRQSWILRFSAKRGMHFLKYKLVNIHRSIFYKMRSKIRFSGRLVYDISEYLLITVIDGDHFGFESTKSLPPFLEKCGSLFFDKCLKLPETVVKPHSPKFDSAIMVLKPTIYDF